jgi:hypothetical protein
MHLVALYESMITRHFYGRDKNHLIEATGRHFTERIAESRAHTETLHKLSAEQKQQQIREQIDFLRQSEREFIPLLDRHTAWESGVHDLRGESKSDSFFSAGEAVYLFIDE